MVRNRPFSLEDLVEDTILDLVCFRIVRERDRGDEGDGNVVQIVGEILDTPKKWPGIEREDPVVSEFSRKVRNGPNIRRIARGRNGDARTGLV